MPMKRSLSFLLIVQIALSVLSAGFSPAILLAFVLMIAAPISFLRSMSAHGATFVVFPSIAGLVLFPGMVVSPVFGVWFALILFASAICWNRAPGAPKFPEPDAW